MSGNIEFLLCMLLLSLVCPLYSHVSTENQPRDHRHSTFKGKKMKSTSQVLKKLAIILIVSLLHKSATANYSVIQNDNTRSEKSSGHTSNIGHAEDYSRRGCHQSKLPWSGDSACYSLPEDCTTNCILTAYVEKFEDKDLFKVTVEGEFPTGYRWIAVGISDDNVLGNDALVKCFHNGARTFVSPPLYENLASLISNETLLRKLKPWDELPIDISSIYGEEFFECTFKLPSKFKASNELTIDMNDYNYIIIAHGPRWTPKEASNSVDMSISSKPYKLHLKKSNRFASISNMLAQPVKEMSKSIRLGAAYISCYKFDEWPFSENETCVQEQMLQP